MSKKKYSEKEHKSIEAGFLPSSEHVQTIVGNNYYYSIIKNKDGDEILTTLVGWAYLTNGVCMPLIYDSEFKTLRNPEVIEGFIEIRESDFEDEEEVEIYEV